MHRNIDNLCRTSGLVCKTFARLSSHATFWLINSGPLGIDRKQIRAHKAKIEDSAAALHTTSDLLFMFEKYLSRTPSPIQ